MTINYVKTPDDKKLFSFHRHDYNEELGTFIDGGFDYTRTNSEVFQGTIEELIGEIRAQFQWTSILNKDGSLKSKAVTKYLFELDSDHLVAILQHMFSDPKKFTYYNDNPTANGTINILLAEIKYRFKHGIS